MFLFQFILMEQLGEGATWEQKKFSCLDCQRPLDKSTDIRSLRNVRIQSTCCICWSFVYPLESLQCTRYAVYIGFVIFSYTDLNIQTQWQKRGSETCYCPRPERRKSCTHTFRYGSIVPSGSYDNGKSNKSSYFCKTSSQTSVRARKCTKRKYLMGCFMKLVLKELYMFRVHFTYNIT